MQFSIATWNINSVRLRLNHVLRFLKEKEPDVLCLQETKCPSDLFPLLEFIASGYPYIAQVGQKGYNGVAILSKYPFSETSAQTLCDRSDTRHISITLGETADAAAGLTIHNFYVPAGGDIPDPDTNPKFAHKLQFIKEMHQWSQDIMSVKQRVILVGDLNIAPLEHDVWSHKQLSKVVSHTPIETEAIEALRQETGWIDAIRTLHPEPEKIYTWWSYRSPDWETANKGRRLDHIWTSPDLAKSIQELSIMKETRGWERPSDHVPVMLKMDLSV